MRRGIPFFLLNTFPYKSLQGGPRCLRERGCSPAPGRSQGPPGRGLSYLPSPPHGFTNEGGCHEPPLNPGGGGVGWSPFLLEHFFGSQQILPLPLHLDRFQPREKSVVSPGVGVWTHGGIDTRRGETKNTVKLWLQKKSGSLGVWRLDTGGLGKGEGERYQHPFPPREGVPVFGKQQDQAEPFLTRMGVAPPASRVDKLRWLTPSIEPTKDDGKEGGPGATKKGWLALS